MLYHRTGFPEEDEIVFCKVTKIVNNAVFVEIQEYGRQGMVSITEVAPGRIRNLRDYVEEGRMIVCKVLQVDTERGYIDLSLRRVTSMEKQEKLNDLKQETRAEKVVESLAEQLKKPVKEIYDLIAGKVLKQYIYLYQFFKELAAGSLNLDKYSFEEGFKVKLKAVAEEKFQPSEVTLKGTLTLETYASNGIELIKEALIKGKKSSRKTEIRYLGGGKYSLSTNAFDFKSAEKIITKVVEVIEEELKPKKVTVSFERTQ